MKFTNLRIGPRLSLLAGLLLLLLAVVGIEGWETLKQNNDRTRLAMQNALLFQNSINTARLAQVDFKKQVQEWKDLLLRGNDRAAFEKYRAAFEKQSAATQADLASLREMFEKLRLDTSQIDEFLDAHRTLNAHYMEALAQYDSANKESAHIVDTAVKGMDRAPTAKIDKIVAYILAQSTDKSASIMLEGESSYRSASMILLAIIALAIAAGSAATYWVVRSITLPLSEAVTVAKTVATGDLRHRINVLRKDETGELMASLKEMSGNLARIVAEVRVGTDTINGASGEVATGSQNLSSRVEQQATSLQQTAATMEELTSTVNQNADNAREASALARSASEVAQKGGQAVYDVVKTMGSINESAKKIVDIISVIDGIAFQTNILALNAAVEAARAGEQGKGFAVVAAEVRNLAQRSAGAAKEIKALIDDSVEKVAVGSKLVDQAGMTMKEVVNSVNSVSDIIAEIAAAGREQTSGIGQINTAVSQMDSVTQQNAALVEQTTAVAKSMQEQAQRLANVVSLFKLDGQLKPARFG